MSARRTAHLEGAELMREGDYRRAMLALEQTLTDHGSHVGLRSDLAFAAYLAGDMGSFRLFVDGLEAEFRASESLLSLKSRTLTLVALAKFSEELARVANAADYIERALSLLPPGHGDTFQVRGQKLRLLASFGREDEATLLYRDCLQVSERNPHHFIECYHALMLSEARLLGWAAAWARLEALAARKDLLASDFRLTALDLLEIALEQGDPAASAQALAFYRSHPGDAPDPFERELLRLSESPPAASESDFLRWTRELSPMAQLRLLALEAQRPGGASEGARRRLSLQLDALDHRSRAYLQRKWRSAFSGESAITLTTDEAARAILCGEKRLQLSARAQPWELLRALRSGTEQSPEAMLLALGRSDSESEHESLRINLLRLNKKLAPFAGLDWVVRYGKQKIQIHPRVRFL